MELFHWDGEGEGQGELRGELRGKRQGKRQGREEGRRVVVGGSGLAGEGRGAPTGRRGVGVRRRPNLDSLSSCHLPISQTLVRSIVSGAGCVKRPLAYGPNLNATLNTKDSCNQTKLT